jgi:hypothetical protein
MLQAVKSSTLCREVATRVDPNVEK